MQVGASHMKPILRTIMNCLSENQRYALYRKLAHIPADFYNPDFTVEIAQSQDDLQSAYKLLHDCYVGIKIIDPQPSGLRCNLFSFLPGSTIIVVKLNGKVVGTLSAIKDSNSGLPSDKEFAKENDRFRRQGKVLIEASALAVAPEHRGDHSVSILLMKYLYNYCRRCLDGDYIIGVVHPRSEDFYKALWQFEKNGEPSSYGSLKGAAAIHISMDLSSEHFKKISASFGPEHPTKNLATMIIAIDSRFVYPSGNPGLKINPVITPKTLKYFCLEQKEIWSSMDSKEKQTLIQVYSTYFGRDAMDEFRDFDIQRQAEKEYRTPVRLPSIVDGSKGAVVCEILDLSSHGCFVGWKEALPAAGDTVRVIFRLGGQVFKLSGQVTWNNDGHSLHHGRGFGIRYLQPEPSLTSLLRQLLYGRDAATQWLPSAWISSKARGRA